MAKLHIDRPHARGLVRNQAVAITDDVTTVGKSVFVANTPVLSGVGQKSVHRKVYADGQFVAGDETDGNENPTPDYATDANAVIGIVASNEIAEVGYEYLHFPNDGVKGRTGKHFKEQTGVAMEQRQRELVR